METNVKVSIFQVFKFFLHLGTPQKSALLTLQNAHMRSELFKHRFHLFHIYSARFQPPFGLILLEPILAETQHFFNH